MTDRCAGVSLRGYRRGEQCGAIPKYASRGKMYCAAHYTTAQKEPKRFREAIEAYVRGEARREAQRRATKAQIDAFPVAEDSCGGCGARYDVNSYHKCDSV
jgi:hypothetical protein